MNIKNIKIHRILNEDWPAIEDLKRRYKLTCDKPILQMQTFSSNPFFDKEENQIFGWVAKDGKKVVGALCFVPTISVFNNISLRTAIASSFVVDVNYRSISLTLFSKFANLKGYDLFLDTTALPPVDTFLKLFKFKALPGSVYRKVLFYVCDFNKFFISFLKKKKIPSIMIIAFKTLFFIPLKLLNIIDKKPSNKNLKYVFEINHNSIGEEFDLLWDTKMKEENNIIFSSRNSSFLKWHLTKANEKGLIKIFGYYSDTILHGYIIVMKEEVDSLSLIKFKIVDIFVKGDEKHIVNALINHSFSYAKQNGGVVFEMIGHSKKIRKLFKNRIYFLRYFPSSPYHYKLSNNNTLDLSSYSNWYPTLYDGDSIL